MIELPFNVVDDWDKRFINGKMKSKESIKRLRVGEKVYEKDEELCEVMNEQLQSVFVLEDGEEIESKEQKTQEMPQLTVEVGEVLDLMKKLDARKAMGPDGVSGWVLKECAEQLVEPICHIINHSLEKGRLPKEWKRADITPIYKGGEKEDPLNYRPVSLTSIVCKLCEKVIRKRWTSFLEKKEMLTKKQFGFREGSSYTANLLSFYSRVTDVFQERDGWVDYVYLDLLALAGTDFFRRSCPLCLPPH